MGGLGTLSTSTVIHNIHDRKVCSHSKEHPIRSVSKHTAVRLETRRYLPFKGPKYCCCLERAASTGMAPPRRRQLRSHRNEPSKPEDHGDDLNAGDHIVMRQ